MDDRECFVGLWEKFALKARNKHRQAEQMAENTRASTSTCSRLCKYKQKVKEVLFGQKGNRGTLQEITKIPTPTCYVVIILGVIHKLRHTNFMIFYPSPLVTSGHISATPLV